MFIVADLVSLSLDRVQLSDDSGRRHGAVDKPHALHTGVQVRFLHGGCPSLSAETLSNGPVF